MNAPASRVRVLAIGETMTLVAPEDGPLETATRFRLDVGGAESNLASHLARLGVPSAWAGAVGDDATGRRLVATLASRGVDVSLVRTDPEAPTGLYLKDPRPEGTRVIYHRRGSAASRLDDAFVDALAPLIDEAELVHLSGITPALSAGCRALVERVLARRAAAGRPVSFDVNYRAGLWPAAEAAPVLRELAARADLVFVGRDEAAALWGMGEELSAREVRALLPRPRLVVKDGGVAAHLFDGASEWTVPTPPVAIVEPVGAGDAFAAGFLAAELAGADPADALAAGHRSAAVALTTPGDF